MAGIGDLFSFVALGVARGGGEGEVDGLVAEVEEEGLLAAPVLEPLDGLVGEDVGVVALELLAAPVDVELWIEVGALALEANPVVEAGSGFVVVVAHVPFADEGGAVAVLLEVLGEEDGALGNRALVVDHAMVVHVLAGQDGGAARGAEGSGDEGVGEVGAFPRETVEGGSFQPLGGVLMKSHEVEAVIVAEDEHDVRGGGQEGEGKEERTSHSEAERRRVGAKGHGASVRDRPSMVDAGRPSI